MSGCLIAQVPIASPSIRYGPLQKTTNMNTHGHVRLRPSHAFTIGAFCLLTSTYMQMVSQASSRTNCKTRFAKMIPEAPRRAGKHSR